MLWIKFECYFLQSGKWNRNSSQNFSIFGKLIVLHVSVNKLSARIVSRFGYSWIQALSRLFFGKWMWLSSAWIENSDLPMESFASQVKTTKVPKDFKTKQYKMVLMSNPHISKRRLLSHFCMAFLDQPRSDSSNSKSKISNNTSQVLFHQNVACVQISVCNYWLEHFCKMNSNTNLYSQKQTKCKDNFKSHF